MTPNSYLQLLHKHGNDLRLLNSYRKHILQNVYSKLLEKMVARKVMCHLETDHFQWAFNPNRRLMLLDDIDLDMHTTVDFLIMIFIHFAKNVEFILGW
uniref:Uncharacterized protein n=1 Tax=Arion vulgaris TaxID=1028688 RepID=A0A0B7AW46_9EUPU